MRARTASVFLLLLLASLGCDPADEPWNWEDGVAVCEEAQLECAQVLCDDDGPDCLDFISCSGSFITETEIEQLHRNLLHRVTIVVHRGDDTCHDLLSGVDAFRFE